MGIVGFIEYKMRVRDVMIVPIIFTLDPIYENLSQTWVFYKAVSFALKNNGAVIAQEHYFSEWEKQQTICPQFFRKEICEIFEYDMPQILNVRNVPKISIPKQIEDNYIEKFGNRSDAYMATYKQDWKEIEDFLCNELEKLEKKYNQKIEAITSLTYLKFLDNISKRLEIPIIYYEWGPFRHPVYRNTAYIDINKKYKDVAPLYKLFKDDTRTKKLPILTRKELLALFLTNEYIKYLKLDESNFELYDKYEMGIIGGYNSLTETSSYTHLNMLDLYYDSLQKFDSEKVAVRYHPGDPLHSQMQVKNEKQGSLVEFILSCKRIAAISSNVEVEAMMYGKVVYDIGRFKYKGLVNDSIIKLEDDKVNDEVLNFIVFVILVPFELLNSYEYLKFRLSDPELSDIYMYHMQYYLSCIGLSVSDMIDNDPNLLEKILKYKLGSTDEKDIVEKFNQSVEVGDYVNIQKYKNKFYAAEEKLRDAQTEINSLTDTLRKELEANKNLAEQLNEQEKRIQDIEKKYDQMINSRSMKLIKPFQRLYWLAKQMKNILYQTSEDDKRK